MEFVDQEESLRKNVKLLIKNLYGYTDENNPFGDPNLTKPFIWEKKNQKYLSMGIDPSSINDEKTILQKIKNAKSEIDYLNKLRAEREANKAPKVQIETNNIDWKEKDDSFLLTQEQLRTEIRIKQGREKPIDFFIKVLKIYKKQFPLPKNFFMLSAYKHPYELFDLLSIDNIKELYKDLKFHADIDKEDINFWNSLICICETKLIPSKMKLYDDTNKDIVEVIRGIKTIAELNQLEKELTDSLNNEFKNEEIQFWKNSIEVLQIEKSKMSIDNIYNKFISENKEEIEAIQKATEKEEEKEDESDDGNLSPPLYESDEELRKCSITEHDYLFKMSENRKKILSYKLNQWQKKYIEETTALKKQAIKDDSFNSDDEVENFLNKISSKSKIKKPIKPSLNIVPSNDVNNIKESRFDLEEEVTQNSKDVIEEISHIESEELGDNENMFNEVVPITVSYDWATKYKPMKPRYSNRVRIGYEWNKYNQAHYDFDNPPPKIIQGYKFNIFYPYLIDKTKTPEYILERADCSDMCIIRFHAGAPYEDIAFKIANREWDMTERAGFKNIFDKGILRLYFKFKRYRYKR